MKKYKIGTKVIYTHGIELPKKYQIEYKGEVVSYIGNIYLIKLDNGKMAIARYLIAKSVKY